MTINSKTYCQTNSCTHASSIIEFKPYVVESKGNGVCGSTKGKGPFRGGGKTGFLCGHLEGVDKGHLGIGGHTRVPNTTFRETSPASQTPRRGILPGTDSSPGGGGGFLITESSNLILSQHARGFLFHPIPSSQEEWPNEASYQPETVEQVGRNATFQNGGHPDPEGPVENRGLDGEGRLEGCLLHNSHSQSSPAVSPVPSSRSVLPVHLPPIRPVLCPVDIHQGDETTDDSAEVMGYQDNSLYRRHADTGRFQGRGNTTPRSTVVSAGSSGVYDQFREVSPMPFSRNRISGFTGGLPRHSTQTPRGEVEADSQRSSRTSTEGTGISSSPLPVHREAECCLSGHYGSPPLLPSLARRSAEGTSPGVPRLQLPSGLIPTSQGGAGLVADSSSQLEWPDHSPEAITANNPIRCLSGGVGSSLRRSQNWRFMDSSGAGNAHQLPGTSCHRLGNEVIPQGPQRCISSAAAGQLDSCGLHQQSGGNSVPNSHLHGQITLAVGSGERHNDLSTAYSRSAEHDSRPGVQGGERQIRLDALSSSVPESEPDPGPPGSGPVRVQANSPTTTLLQLETRPTGRGSRCLSAELEPAEGLCQPSMVPGGTGTEQGEDTGSSIGPDSSSLERPVLVSSSSGNAEGPPPSSHATAGPNAEGRTTEARGVHPPTGRLACLREKFRNSCLSEEASNLMLASWRTKSSQTYDSLFNKWVSWCAERHRDPVSGPIADVANFLAYLFEEGYKSRSLNSFRSAISSAHDPVDGVEVGKHPTISRLLKGAYHSRPPLPRYTTTWNVQVVLQYLDGLGPSASLSLKHLTFKLVMLLGLTRPSRSADLASLQLDRRRFKPEGVEFLPSSLAKQSSQGRVLREFFFPSFPHNPNLCPVETLRHYESATYELRPKDTTSLFVAIVKPHKPVASCTIARWLRETLKLAGIDVSIFAGHSVRGAATSAAAGSGVTMSDIMQAADWSSESVFRNFYYRPSHDTTFGRAVLSSSAPPGET